MSAPESPPTASTPLPWLRLVLWFCATRLGIWLFAGASVIFMPKGQFFYEPRGPIDWLIQWDARWFLPVATHGYDFDPERMSSVNFFPLYPMCVRAATWLIRDINLAAYMVSHAFCFAAAVLLWRLTHDVTGRDKAADGAVAFFLLGPVSVFFASIYSEATFLFFALASVLAARRDQWLLAGLCGGAAALSRSVGLFLVVPLVIEFWQRHRALAAWRPARTWMRFACCAFPALGVAAFAGFLWWRFDNPQAYLISQRHGGHETILPWMFFKSMIFNGLEPFYKVWFGGAAIAGIVLTIAGALLRLPLSLTGFSVVLTLLYLSTCVEALPRFFSVVFPFYCTLGIVRARWPVVGNALLIASTLLLAMSVAFFVNGYWFT